MKKTKRYSAATLALLKDSSLSSSEVARRIGRQESCVRSARRKLGLASFAQYRCEKIKSSNLPERRQQADNDYWQRQYKELERTLVKAVKDLSAVDRLVASVKEVAPTSYSPAPKVNILVRGKRETPESAVLLFSDTHVGKITRPEQTLGFSEYNFATFLSRLKLVESAVLSILTNHTNAPLNKLVVAMLGDMLDGTLNHGSEASHHNAKFNQFFAAGHAIAQMFRNLAAHVPQLDIETVVGNHTRYGEQKKMPTENRHSNFDMFLYAFIQALTADIKNIHWNLSEQPFAVFSVEGWNFFASHGDNLRGGDKAMGIPLHSMARQMNATTQLFIKHNEKVPDYYVLGHFHRPIQIPTAMGDFTINGGFPGLDNYALDGNFNPVDPMQVFFKVHPKYGKIAEYKLHLKHAKLGTPTYDIPGVFPCV